MTGYIINGNILHPVDSFENKLTGFKNIELLILPTMAPFCNELQVTAFADTLSPKNILPLHNGYAKEFFVKLRNQTFVKHFEVIGVNFLQPPSAILTDGTEVVFKYAI